MPKTVLWIVAMSLAPSLVFSRSMPGQDLNASASITYCQITQLDAEASITYLDSAGNLVEESPSTQTTVFVETSLPEATDGPVTTFVKPDTDARVFFTVARSFYMGASLAGQYVKVQGRIRIIGGTCYVDDGSVKLSIDSATGRKIGSPLRVPLRTDLLTSTPLDGEPVIIQGVCRREDDGQLSLLPLSDSAINRLQ